MLILSFPEYHEQAQRLAYSLAMPLDEIYLHHFPDGESLLNLPSGLAKHVLLCRSLNQPNDKLIELLLCAKTLRQQGVQRLTLVAPYLCYMRQDYASHPGEVISQGIIGELLAGLFDDVITVDPHLHRISHLSQAVPVDNAISLTASDLIAKFLSQHFDHAILLGPDAESEQWVASIAAKSGFDYGVAEKIRQGDKQVQMVLPELEFKQHTVIIIDDMASTGRTLAKATKMLLKAGAKDVYAVITHALFCGDAEDYIRQSGMTKIWSTDSISHPSACIFLDKLLAQAIKDLMRNENTTF